MKITARRLRKLLHPLRRTPLHPQFLSLTQRDKTAAWLNRHATGKVIDIGCGNDWIKTRLSPSIDYISVDYPETTSLGYSGNPDIYANAEYLPFSDGSVDAILLLDVLEHIENADRAVAESARVLRPGGRCLIHVPFMYPLHDEPFDYKRWTKHGLVQLMTSHGFTDIDIIETSNPIETASALTSIAFSRATLDSITRLHYSVIFTPLLIALIPVVNAGGWIFGKIFPSSHIMPYSYLVSAATDSQKHATTSPKS